MKNTDIHQDLDKSEVRDLIAKGIIDTYERELTHYSFTPGTRLEQAHERFRVAKLNLEAAKEQDAFNTILKTLGWEEFDVSDETSNPYGKYYMSFIGTKEEYDQLIITIDNEKDSI